MRAFKQRVVHSILVTAFLHVGAPALFAQATGHPSQNYAKVEAMIPMRDGVKLNTEIYIPNNAREAMPMLMVRTPYGLGHDDKGYAPALKSSFKELAQEGFVFVLQDIRGRFKSEGQFVMLRTPRDKKDAKAVDESTDTYDTIEWLLKNVPNNNGRVGIFGISYGGWLAVMAMLDPHPALKACSPQASPADMYLGDDFHHNGAFRLSYGFEYVAMMETTKENTNFNFGKFDTFEWYLKLGALSNVNSKYFFGKRPSWNDFVDPNYDDFWKKQAFAPYLRQVTVPMLNVAGWWDQEDFYGPIKIYDLLEKTDSKKMNYLVVGPWNHGGWANGDGRKLGNIDFEQATAKHFREKIQLPWFTYLLKDKGNLDLTEAHMFQTGDNKWVKHVEWPPRSSTEERALYFRSGGKLSFDPPKDGDDSAGDSYISDPAHPVPYRVRPIEPTYPGPGWPAWLVQDQRFVHLRPDVLSFETEPLSADVVVAGNILADLFASTTGSDSDWVVKLIDVYPDDYPKDPKMRGYQLMVANDVLRGRFRKSFEKPEPVKPGEVNEYKVDLHAANHCFRAGHKIMVQVQSTWFPVIDRNPQKYVDNIFEAKDEDYQMATQKVFRSKKWASHVAVPVMKP